MTARDLPPWGSTVSSMMAGTCTAQSLRQCLLSHRWFTVAPQKVEWWHESLGGLLSHKPPAHQLSEPPVGLGIL